jgi:DNA-binding LacI/PurR family transcriptional regulator
MDSEETVVNQFVPKGVTQRELARRLGVSQATVSRVLAKNARHSQKMRETVTEAAVRLGYRPDPVFANMNEYKRLRRAVRRQTLAWFSAMPYGAGQYETMLFQAARARAEALGYGMDYFWEHDPGYSSKRYEQIFSTRGIAGVIFGPRTQPHARVEMEIDHFAAVAMGRSVDWPPVDRVSTDHFQTMTLCYDSVRARGFRRIGFSLAKSYSERVDGVWTAAFLGQQLRNPGLPKIPPLLDDDPSASGNFKAWFRKWKPEALITMGWHFGHLGALRRMGLRFPEVVGVALLVVPCYVPEDFPALNGFSGILEPLSGLAAFAVDILVGRIRNNERGIPADRRVHLLPGTWTEGTTLREK